MIRAGLALALLSGCYPWDDFEVRDPALEPPRPVAPPAGVRLTGMRPLFRWELPAGLDGAVIEVCADRACTEISRRFEATGDSAAPPDDLPRGTFYWRLRGKRGETIGERTSAVWSAVARSRGANVTAWHAPVLDLDGDGLADLAIPSPGAGRVFVYLGRADRMLVEHAALEVAPTTDPRGLAAVNAGDVDGDGFVDLAVAARSDCDTPYPHAGPPGVVYLFHGAPAGPEARPARTLTISDSLVCFAHAASGADLDADGYSDLAVAMRERDDSRVYSGGAAGLADVPLARPVVVAPDEVAELGRSISSGDVDADGVSDVVFEAYGSPGFVVAPFVLRGGRGAPAEDYERLPTPASFGTNAASAAGVAGDVDADGLPDVVLCDPNRVAVLASSRDPSSPYDIESRGGKSMVRALGDLDADGFDDFAVGIPSERRVRVFFGGDPSGTLEAVDLEWDAIGELSEFGQGIAGPGDVDGDGFDDLLIGAPEVLGPSGALLSGRAYLYFGGDRSLSEFVRINGADLASGYFGSGLTY